MLPLGIIQEYFIAVLIVQPWCCHYTAWWLLFLYFSIHTTEEIFFLNEIFTFHASQTTVFFFSFYFIFLFYYYFVLFCSLPCVAVTVEVLAAPIVFNDQDNTAFATPPPSIKMQIAARSHAQDCCGWLKLSFSGYVTVTDSLDHVR